MNLINTATSSELPQKKRMQAACTFEWLPTLMGFGPDVFFEGVKVDHARNIISFYFHGAGLAECEAELDIDLTTYEGMECKEILPPAWQKLNE